MHERGEIYIANLNPPQGSEQSGTRPVLIVQADLLNRVGNTIIIIPFTTNLRRATLPSSVLIQRGEGGLTSDSVALCHQIRAVDKSRLQTRTGKISPTIMNLVEEKIRYTLWV